MSIEWAHGFEDVANNQDFNRLYSVVSVDTNPAPGTPGRLGWGREISELNHVKWVTPALGAGAIATRRAAMTFYILNPQSVGTNSAIIELRDGATNVQVQVAIDSSNDTSQLFSLAVQRGDGTTLGSTGEIFPYSTYLRIEFEATINNTTGAYELRVEGSMRLSATGVDTQITGNATCDRVAWAVHDASNCRADDWIVNNDLGGVNTGFLGDVQIEGLQLLTEGDADDWVPSAGTDNAAMIDEFGTTPADDDTTFIASSVDNQEDLYNPADADDIPDGDVLCVVQRSQVKVTSAGTRFYRHRVKRAGVTADADAASHSVTSTSYGFKISHMQQDPTDSSTWTRTKVNASQFGQKSLAS